MTTINLNYKRLPADQEKYGPGRTLNSLSHTDFNSFNKSILGLGDLSMDGEYINALASFLDLQGFTHFCNQVDSHLVIPEFISKYTEWLFKEIGELFVEGKYRDHVKIWGSLPFYAKFLGDGILFLWNTDLSGGFTGICNITKHLLLVNHSYKTKFYPKIKKEVSNPPSILRCGIARGQIISIGDGKDYVGSCINLAARLQKISLLTFALSRRGFDESQNPDSQLWSKLILKKTSIRGIGDEELIYVLKDEFDNLPIKEKKKFKD